MKLIKPSVEILEQPAGIQGIYDMIELCGKTSYKSPVKGGKVAEDFVSARVNEGHYAVLEFGTVYLKIPNRGVMGSTSQEYWAANFYQNNPYSRVKDIADEHKELYYWAVTTNMRVLVENGRTTDLEWLCEPTEYHERRYTARFITNIGVTREMCRHRTFSFCEQSTRYCNYNSGKFGGQVTYVIPAWAQSLHEGEEQVYSPFEITPKEAELMQAWYDAEKRYKAMLKSDSIPQEARSCLPLGTATEICVCGFKNAWGHFFALRYYGLTGKPHPDMLNVATMCYNAFKEKGIQF